MRSWCAAFVAVIGITCTQPAWAQQLVYTPINPSFGGNPFNSAHLLGIANAENNYKDPSVKTGTTQADIFASQLQSRLLAALSTQITDAIFGANPQNSGTVTFGSQSIAWQRDLTEVTLTITDTGTGQVTTVQVPTIVNLTGGQ